MKTWNERLSDKLRDEIVESADFESPEEAQSFMITYASRRKISSARSLLKAAWDNPNIVEAIRSLLPLYKQPIYEQFRIKTYDQFTGKPASFGYSPLTIKWDNTLCLHRGREHSLLGKAISKQLEVNSVLQISDEYVVEYLPEKRTYQESPQGGGGSYGITPARLVIKKIRTLM